MVVISLYKGNLHKAADVPRPLPRVIRTISRKDFKVLLRRRARALSLLCNTDSDFVTDVATTSDRDPNSNPDCGNSNPIPAGNADSKASGGNRVDYRCSDSRLMVKEDLKEGEGEKNDAREKGKVEDELVEKSDALMVQEEKKDVESVKNDGTPEFPMNKAVETTNTESTTSAVEKRRKEIKEKLEVLNEKKHSLVQVLKQILNVEEHLKGQNNMQGMPSHRPAPLQVENTTDSGSVIRVNTPRTGKGGSPCGDTEIEGGEADDVPNHNTHSRHLPRTSSISPSSNSQHRKPVSNTMSHSYRTTLGVVGSPSRFAPAAQGPPSVSLSGASYIASSPSPAASGGTSVFRDVKLPSPWN